MMFHFRLAPVEDIVPWGPKEAPTLSWFGLTDGWFWIEVADQELFRYSEEAFDYWRKKYPESRVLVLPYESYQVVRYWEDLMNMLPAILDPLPAALAAHVADAEGWLQWQENLLRWLSAHEDDFDARDLYDTANLWWSERTWDAYHLAHPPRIWLWRMDDTIHVRWDNRDVKIGGIPVWAAQDGESTLPVSKFTDEVQSFHDRLISEMGVRVDEVVAGWSRPEVKIDIPGLVRGQEERRERLKYALAPRPEARLCAFTWNEVREAIATVDIELAKTISVKDDA